MNYLIYTTLTLFALLCAPLAAAGKPNIVFILADDMGYSDLGCYGGGHDPNAPPGSAASYLCLGPGFSSACNTPFRRHKTWTHEGGCSTPLIAHWPAGIAARGELRRTPGHVIDFVPTALELAGIEKPKEWNGEPIPEAPGRSLVLAFASDLTIARESLWWLHEGHRAIRVGDLKLVAASNTPWELYDLTTDRAEQNNFAAQMPDKVQELAALWQQQTDDFTRAADSATGSRPNVLFVMLDDAGWTDLGSFGGRMLTPNVDRLAEQGMRFTDAHAPAPNCSPSRAGILTGRIPARVGIYSYLPEAHPMHLHDEEVTVAELARQTGYRTGHFGKWHLSDLDNDAQPGPLDQGFEYSLATSNNAAPSHLNPDNFQRNGKSVGKLQGYSCQIVVDEVINWLDEIDAEKKDAEPFLACVWFHEPHTPIASPPELIEACLERHPDLNRREAEYLANIENVDRAVGRLLEWLEDRQLAEETVIWFTSDNGPLNAFSKGGLRGFKSNVWEGGHRVPAIVRWPGRIEPGSECSAPVSSLDFLPTFCDLANVKPPQDRAIDGASQLPLWTGHKDQFARSTPLYWYFYRLNPSIAMRDGKWAIVAQTDDSDRPKAHPLLREDMPYVLNAKPNSWQLYDIDRDQGQRDDLADEEPQQLQRMKRMLEDVHANVLSDAVHWDIPEAYGTNAKRRVWNSQ